MSKNASSPYQEAGNVVNELVSKSGGRGLKSIIFAKNKSKGMKARYATVCKCMQQIPTINAILNDDAGKLRKAIKFDDVHNKGLMYVMLYELLFSKYKSIRGGGRLKRMIIKYERELRESIDAHAEKHGAGDRAVNLPRYVRVNVMQTSTSAMVKTLQEIIGERTKDDASNGELGNIMLSFFADAHIPDLLVLHPLASSLLHHDTEIVKSGKIILQDKSSCFSALALARGNSNAPMGDFIDACAAPGNKTSHLAALVSAFYDDTLKSKKKKGKRPKPSSTIFAFERSSARFKVLKSRIETLVPTQESGTQAKIVVEPLLRDFLKSDPKDPQFSNVRGILLDPSCSGSGIVNSPDRWLEDAAANDNDEAKNEDKDKRIQSLANFQLVALKHAMSFPSVDRIVYSTCSVNDEENEEVVGKALTEIFESKKGLDGDVWQLVAPACLSNWPRRGRAGIGGLTENQAKCLIRCDGLDGDETNGFFVCYFERKRVVVGSDKSIAEKSSCGLPVYEGQFSNNTETNKATPGRTMTEKKVSVLAAESKDPSASNQGAQSKNDKSKDKIAKKKAKKLAWKQKQALQKSLRLQERKEKNKNYQIVNTKAQKL